MPRVINDRIIDLPYRSYYEGREERRAVDMPPKSQMGNLAPHRNDCGPACVAMALDYLSRAPGMNVIPASVKELADEADPNDDGTSAQDLAVLARAHGAIATVRRLRPDEMPVPPAILLVRYSAFRPESVCDHAYWRKSASCPWLRHWMWWLGNDMVGGRTVSVWNDPLYPGQEGKHVAHTLDELQSAFVAYGNQRIAVTFDAIANLPEGEAPLEVYAYDIDGVRLRSEPSTAKTTTIIATLPQGHRLMVNEDAESARAKMSQPSDHYWLRAQTGIDGMMREGFVAAWLVRPVEREGMREGTREGTREGVEIAPPTPPYSWQAVINATYIAAVRADGVWQDWLARAGFMTAFREALRNEAYSGPAIEHWPLLPEQRSEIIRLLGLSSGALLEELSKARAEARTKLDHRPTIGALVGIHGAPGIGVPLPERRDEWINLLRDMGIRWYKQCDDGNTNQRRVLDWAKQLKQAGIEPIIRYYKDCQFPEPLPDEYFTKMRLYADAGIQWAEIGNEPNLPGEWKGEWQRRVDWKNQEVIRLLARGWVNDARRALDAGVKPAFYAFGPTDWWGKINWELSSVKFVEFIAQYLAENAHQQTLDIFRRGAWLAVHCATYEQPYDFHPLRPDGSTWDVTLRGYEVVINAFSKAFGGDLNLAKVPILSTEGGVFTPDSSSMNLHDRLRTDEEHAGRVVGMFEWLERHSPLAAMCPWCLSYDGFDARFSDQFVNDGWLKKVNGALQPRPVVEAMKKLRRSRAQLESVARMPEEPLQLNPEWERQLWETAVCALPE